MRTLDITLNAPDGTVTLADGGEVCRIDVARETLAQVNRTGPDAALAVLANVATGHGLGILEAAARARTPVALDGIPLSADALRAALARPRYVA